MKIQLVTLTATYAFLSIGAVTAAEQTERNQVADASIAPAAARNLAFGSGMGSGMPVSGSGSGSQTFGGGFNNQQQTAGSGPLSTNPPTVAGRGSAMARP